MTAAACMPHEAHMPCCMCLSHTLTDSLPAVPQTGAPLSMLAL